jgi:GGDEF domain-containing protein
MAAASFGRRPHPVADVPPSALADGEATAKGWLLALIDARPLRDAPALPTADFAAGAPALCAAILRAVGSDAGLAGLEPLAARAGALAGAGGAGGTVAAIGLLRGALWEALTQTMMLDAPTTAALADRLGFVCDAVAVAALGGGEVRVHDARGDWRATAERHVAGGRAFALVAIEADDAARLRAADGDGAAAALAGVEEAVRGELRPGDILGREEDGRLWVVAAELNASGGRALAERLADAVATVAPLRGAPLTVSMGIASSPADGTDVGTLAAHADQALYAARASGVPIA